MKITLDTVRTVLKNALGFDSYIAGFITQVIEDPQCRTASIDKNGILRYNPEFVDRYVNSSADCFCLCMHEVSHCLYRHFILQGGEIVNIAADAIINAVISTVFSIPSNKGQLFQKFYAPTGLSGLLRPESRMRSTSLARLYDALYYPWHGRECGALTTGEIIQSLKILLPGIPPVPLLGTHGLEAEGEEREGFSKETLAQMAGEIQCLARSGNHSPGHSAFLMELLMEALRTHLSIRRVLLAQFVTKRKVDRFKETLHARRLTTSPIPIHPSKRDLVLLSAGIYPFHFHHTADHFRKEDRGLAVYLDVSGSVNEHLPQILGVLQGLRKEIQSVFQFSNKVIETPFENLLKGRIQTTYGTDFDCIAESILERKFEKAVIITDGYASMKQELRDQLKERGLRALTILFANARECEEFAEFGDVVQLEDICEERR